MLLIGAVIMCYFNFWILCRKQSLSAVGIFKYWSNWWAYVTCTWILRRSKTKPHNTTQHKTWDEEKAILHWDLNSCSMYSRHDTPPTQTKAKQSKACLTAHTASSSPGSLGACGGSLETTPYYIYKQIQWIIKGKYRHCWKVQETLSSMSQKHSRY